MIFFLFLKENICCGYLLEAPRRGTSNEYPQHMFLFRNKKDISIFRMKKAPYLLLCLGSAGQVLKSCKTHKHLQLFILNEILVNGKFEIYMYFILFQNYGFKRA